MNEFDVWRTYKSRPTLCIKLKTDTDEIISADLIEENSHKDVLLVTNMAFGLYYDLDEVPVVGARAAGVKSINLKADDFVVDSLILDRGEDVTITIVTQRGSIKRMKVSELSKLGRAKRGLMVLRELKSNPHRVFSVVKNQDNKMIHIVAENNKVYQVNYKDLPINDRQSNGSFIIDEKQDGSVKEVFTEIIE
jgi:topoisomerase-4 subunit A